MVEEKMKEENFQKGKYFQFLFIFIKYYDII